MEELRELLRGVFRLTKWYSNSREAMVTILASKSVAKSVAILEIERLPTDSDLGMKWNIEDV